MGLISFEPLESPCFADWDMRLADLYDLPAGPRDVLAAKYAHKNGEIAIPEHLPEIYAFLLDARAICLSTPWQRSAGDSPAARPSS